MKYDPGFYLTIMGITATVGVVRPLINFETAVAVSGLGVLALALVWWIELGLGRR